MSPRDDLLGNIADRILSLPPSQINRVAIDGVDGAGKTFMADELAASLNPSGRPIIRASMDSFHNPREIRYRLGKSSPEGFFRDSYNYEKLKSLLLDPLSPGGTRLYQDAAFDHRTNKEVSAPARVAPEKSIFVIDGIFLHRPELCCYWDFSMFLDVDFEVSFPRCAARGDGSPDPRAESNRRYRDGQRLYFAECKPKDFATVVIDNNDLERPVCLT